MVAIDPFAIEEGAQIQPRNKTLRCFYRKPTPKLSTFIDPLSVTFFFFCYSCRNCPRRELTRACDVILPTPIGHPIYILSMSYSTIS